MLEIRKAAPLDAEAIARLLNACLNETEYLIRTPFEPYDKSMVLEEIMLSELNAPSIRLIAEYDGMIVADLIFCTGRQFKIKHMATMALCVLKSYWNRGIGSALLSRTLQHAQENGIKKISIEVFANNVRAIALYSKFGFVTEGKKKKAVRISETDYIDIIIMGLHF